MLISQIGLLEPIQNQDHGIIPGCPRNPYRFIHTKCPLSRLTDAAIIDAYEHALQHAQTTLLVQPSSPR